MLSDLSSDDFFNSINPETRNPPKIPTGFLEPELGSWEDRDVILAWLRNYEHLHSANPTYPGYSDGVKIPAGPLAPIPPNTLTGFEGMGATPDEAIPSSSVGNALSLPPVSEYPLHALERAKAAAELVMSNMKAKKAELRAAAARAKKDGKPVATSSSSSSSSRSKAANHKSSSTTTTTTDVKGLVPPVVPLNAQTPALARHHTYQLIENIFSAPMSEAMAAKLAAASAHVLEENPPPTPPVATKASTPSLPDVAPMPEVTGLEEQLTAFLKEFDPAVMSNVLTQVREMEASQFSPPSSLNGSFPTQLSFPPTQASQVSMGQSQMSTMSGLVLNPATAPLTTAILPHLVKGGSFTLPSSSSQVVASQPPTQQSLGDDGVLSPPSQQQEQQPASQPLPTALEWLPEDTVNELMTQTFGDILKPAEVNELASLMKSNPDFINDDPDAALLTAPVAPLETPSALTPSFTARIAQVSAAVDPDAPSSAPPVKLNRVQTGVLHKLLFHDQGDSMLREATGVLKTVGTIAVNAKNPIDQSKPAPPEVLREVLSSIHQVNASLLDSAAAAAGIELMPSGSLSQSGMATTTTTTTTGRDSFKRPPAITRTGTLIVNPSELDDAFNPLYRKGGGSQEDALSSPDLSGKPPLARRRSTRRSAAPSRWIDGSGLTSSQEEEQLTPRRKRARQS